MIDKDSVMWSMMKRKPTGIEVPIHWISDQGRFLWQFGFELHKVRFADHRSGWMGLQFSVMFGPFSWTYNIIKWRATYRAPDTHGAITIEKED